MKQSAGSKNQVSIHAPTKGATANIGDIPVYKYVSIHAPTKGATEPDNRSDPTKRGFNPRSHEGSDYNDWFRDVNYDSVSIHAPTKGATLITPFAKSSL